MARNKGISLKQKYRYFIGTICLYFRANIVYTVKKDLHEIGIIAMQTSFGHSVPVYDMERTICDLLRSRKNVEMQVFQDALKQYAKRKDKNLRMLMKYAAMFHVENILRPYLEVLL